MRLFIVVSIFCTALLVAGCSWQQGVDGDAAQKQDQTSDVYQETFAQRSNVPGAREGDHMVGNANAPATMIIYSDFECLFCAQFESEGGSVQQARQLFGDKLRIVFRHNPLPTHAYAQIAAQASECAAEQGKFWQMHDELYKDTSAGRLDSEQIAANARSIRLDMDKFSKCLQDETYRQKILDSIQEAQSVGAYGTPTSFVNGIIVVGATPFTDYQAEDGIRPGLRTIITKAIEETGN